MFNKVLKDKKTKNFIIIVLIIICIFSILINMNNSNEIELTQLRANSHRQMMGYIIKTSNNEVIVIDGGTKEDSENLKNHINELGGKVDYWFLTHPHDDHVGAFMQLIEDKENIEIGKIYYTINSIDWYKENALDRFEEVQQFINILSEERIKNIAEEVTLNQKIKMDNINCEILGVKNPEITVNAINNSSMVIKMHVNNQSILFLADTGEESGDKLLNTQKNKLKSNIVQMAHHGQNGAKETLYKEISPQICLWPTPEWIWNNDNGNGENTGPWTTLDTRLWMENLGVKTNIIEKDGDITISVK